MTVQARRRRARRGLGTGAAAGIRVDPPRHGRRVEPLRVGEVLGVLDRLAADLLVVEDLLDERRRAALVDDVGRDEGLHLRGDRQHRRLGGRGVRRARRRDLLGDLPHRLLDEAEREQEVALRGLHLARDAEPLRLARVALRDEAQLVDLRRHVDGGGAAGGQRGEEVVDVGVGLLDEARGVAVVVLERLLLAAVEAALDAEDEQEGEHDDEGRRPEAAHRELLWIDARARRRRHGSPGPRAGRARLVIVEEGQDSAPWRGRRWLSMTAAPEPRRTATFLPVAGFLPVQARSRRRARRMLSRCPRPTRPHTPHPRARSSSTAIASCGASARAAWASSTSPATSTSSATSPSSGSPSSSIPTGAASARRSRRRGSRTPGSWRCTRPAATTMPCTSSPSSCAGARWRSSCATATCRTATSSRSA